MNGWSVLGFGCFWVLVAVLRLTGRLLGTRKNPRLAVASALAAGGAMFAYAVPVLAGWMDEFRYVSLTLTVLLLATSCWLEARSQRKPQA